MSYSVDLKIRVIDFIEAGGKQIEACKIYKVHAKLYIVGYIKKRQQEA